MKKLNELNQGFIPDHIISILNKIEHHGFKVFIVGGAVRDLLLGRVPIEYDLASNARPDDICAIFNNTSLTGVAFGTVLIHYNGHQIEITTFRRDGSYTDFRRPESIEFVDKIDDDLSRRDFTINAMAYRPFNQQIIDLHDGQTHLLKRQLVCVGDPVQRFNEDSLRPFRAFRFMSQFGFQLDASLIDALRSQSQLQLPAIERVRQEMDRLLLGPFWMSALQLMASTFWLERWFGKTIDFKAATIVHDLYYRWAWFLSHGDFDELSHYFQFSKKHIRLMKTIIDWNFEKEIIELSVNDLAISSQQLQAMGFSGSRLGQLQSKLLYYVRSKQVVNQPNQLIDFIDQLNIHE